LSPTLIKVTNKVKLLAIPLPFALQALALVLGVHYPEKPMPQTVKIAIALPDNLVEAAEAAVAEGRAGSIHAYFAAAAQLYERQSKGASPAPKKSARTARAAAKQRP
jgi:hypothetical protein